MKHGFAKPKPGWPVLFSKGANHQIQLLHVFGLVSVDVFEALHDVIVAGKVIEGANWIQTQLSPESSKLWIVAQQNRLKT